MKHAQPADISRLNTFGVRAAAPFLFEISSVEDYRQFLAHEAAQTGNALVLGGGSNLLFTAPPAGPVLKMAVPGISIVEQDDAFAWVNAGAGVVWHDLVKFTLAENLGGIENLSLIPGLCGAAPMQNIGAYGTELTDAFVELEALERSSGRLITFSHAECAFGYRSSVFKTTQRGKYLIYSITLKLSRRPEPNLRYGALTDHLSENGIHEPTIQQVSDAVIAIRRSKLPDWHTYGNAGSFFKNPVISRAAFESLCERINRPAEAIPHYAVGTDDIKIPAGWLIDQAGWKGYREGAVGCWPKQALVLVNYGGASGADILAFARRIRDDVHGKYGIRLHPEVNLIGMPQEDF
ncbi:MAG: UDP-N-acetylmuramate dehydrogenase [Cyclonatronaceae bacterium]